MRVISGFAKGTKLLSVPGDTTRPILDRVKTALFDLIRAELPEKLVLDLFAGSGSIGIEALSQGAKHCTFVDVAPAAVKTIRKNLENTHLLDQGEVRQTDSFHFLRKTDKQFDIIFVAPPQYKGIWIEALRAIADRGEILNNDALIVVQIDPTEYEPLALTDFSEFDKRRYGSTLLIFYRKSI